MRNEVVAALLVVGLGGCGTEAGEAPGAGVGGGGFGGAFQGGAPGIGGAQSGGGATNVAGESTTAGSPTGVSGAGASSSAGSSGSTGVSGSAGVGGGPGGSSGTAENGGASGAPVAGAGGSAGSAAGHGGGAGASGAGGATGGAGGSAQVCPAGRPAPSAGDSTLTLAHGGRSRRYILHVPSGLNAGTPLAVVIDLHGAGGNGSQQKGLSGFNSLADRQKFLAVFPDGIDGYWNVDDKCCGTAGQQKIDDVGFLKALITQLSTNHCIDARRIYVTGFSNGGGLAHRMGCDAADVIAAIAPIATDLRTQPCNASRPISMMEVRGMADSLEPYEGGLVGPEGGQYVAVGAKASLKLWADINQCTGTATKLAEHCESYTRCGGGVETDLCSLPNVEHTPYDNALRFDIASVAWSMFERQPMR